MRTEIALFAACLGMMVILVRGQPADVPDPPLPTTMQTTSTVHDANTGNQNMTTMAADHTMQTDSGTVIKDPGHSMGADIKPVSPKDPSPQGSTGKGSHLTSSVPLLVIFTVIRHLV